MVGRRSPASVCSAKATHRLSQCALNRCNHFTGLKRLSNKNVEAIRQFRNKPTHNDDGKVGKLFPSNCGEFLPGNVNEHEVSQKTVWSGFPSTERAKR